MHPKSGSPEARCSSLWFAASCVLPLFCLVVLATNPQRAPAVAGAGLLGIPLLDKLLGRRRIGATRSPWIFAILVLALGLHLTALVYATWLAAKLGFDGELLSLALSVGVCSGFGLNVAHSCCHARQASLRLYGQMMNLLCAQLHTPYEHRWHHATYGTQRDPATARLGESAYRFAIRYVVDGMRVVWRSESKRLAHAAPFERVLLHRGLRAAALPALVLLGTSLALNARASGFLVVQGAVAVFLTVLGNYIAHYGLLRRCRLNGTMEQGSPIHSWNDNHAASKFVLLGLPEHSDHHEHPSRPSWEAESDASAPAFPLPYSWMLLASLVPPLFRQLMDARALALSATAATHALEPRPLAL